MTKDKSKIKDWRSTGRRIARRTLYNSRVDYICVGVPELGIVCGVTSEKIPKDAPKWFEEIWPVEELRAVGKVIASDLQADHETKDLQDNYEDDICWRCPSCHRLHDNLTDKGVSTKIPSASYGPGLTSDSWGSILGGEGEDPPPAETNSSQTT